LMILQQEIDNYYNRQTGEKKRIVKLII